MIRGTGIVTGDVDRERRVSFTGVNKWGAAGEVGWYAVIWGISSLVVNCEIQSFLHSIATAFFFQRLHISLRTSPAHIIAPAHQNVIFHSVAKAPESSVSQYWQQH